jgi:hypothetical protein
MGVVIAFPPIAQRLRTVAAGSRLRRETGVPRHVRARIAGRSPRRLPVELADCDVFYRPGRWNRLEDDERKDPVVRIRETFAWIEKEGECIGAVGFNEIKPAQHYSTGTFVLTMDDHDADYGAIACALASGWPDLEPVAFGPILELSYLWAPLRPSALDALRPVVTSLIQELLPRCSIILALAAPLEYASDDLESEAEKLARTRRRAAMARLARRELGLEALPGDHGGDCFLWRPRPGLEHLIDTPLGAANSA